MSLIEVLVTIFLVEGGGATSPSPTNPNPCSQEKIIVSKCEVNPDYAHLYGLDNVGPGRCDLVVLNASVAEAGTYHCAKCDGFDPAHSAQLVVLGMQV